MKKISIYKWACLLAFFVLGCFGSLRAQDLVVKSAGYDQALYAGYQLPGVYTVVLSSAAAFTYVDGQFEINVSLNPQGPYDVTRSAALVAPAGWEIVFNSNQSIIFRLLAGSQYVGTGNLLDELIFVIPIVTTAAANNEPTLATVQWNDPFTDENTNGNSAVGLLNVLDVNLPVTLVRFTANKEGNTAQLNWATTAETNSDRFEIERSADAKSWKMIGSRVSAGESKVLVSYTAADVSPMNGTNYYRLRMVDRAADRKDESFAYSRIVSLDFQGAGVKLYPNPVSDMLYLKDVDLKNVQALSVLNVSGVTLLSPPSVTADGVSLKSLSSGMYLVKIVKTDGAQSLHKIVIVK